MRSLRVACALMCLASLPAGTAAADPVADFYSGKTITMVIGVSAGGDYDLRARLVARHIGKYIPGTPSVIAQTMLGGGGLVAANWLATVAPRDGTAILAISSNMAVSQTIKIPGVKFDVRKLNWIGNTTDSPNVINSWFTTGVTNIAQVKEKEFVVGATGRSSGSYYYPASLNAYAGTKFKIVTGYPGGADVNLAMERGEVGGRGSNLWASWKSTKPQWLAEKKINILVQIGLKRVADLPDVPLLQELVSDPKAKQVLRFISLDTAIARSLVTTEGAPPARVAALRHAFDQVMKDPAFLAEAEKSQMDISPNTGQETQDIATEIVDTAPDVLAQAAELLGGQ
jgi:tripartite-type tricarboxylate transporter receptor subunit TctC